jgi:hypothetical protein
MIKVANTSTTIHTAHATDLDEIHLWAVNSDTSDRVLTVEYGGVADPDDLIEFTVPTQDGLYMIVPGLVLTNSLVVKAKGSVTNVIMVAGYVIRMTA